MAIHGKPRDMIIRALGNRSPFPRRRNAMSATIEPVTNFGQLPNEEQAAYRQYATDGKIVYTVLSYATPIAYVLTDGTVIVPDVYYSPTTSGHQGMSRAYLR